MKMYLLRKSKKTWSSLFLCSFLFFSVFSVYAQESRTVSGKVVDELGKPLSGTTVQLKGVMHGVSADLDGNFSISVPENSSKILVFSFVGYFTKEEAINSRSIVNVSLEVEPVSLTETVVVGYGVQKKIHATGAIAQIGSNEILRAPVTNLNAALVGQLPGIVTSQNNGAPGSDGTSITIRGTSSFSSNTPLVLVDGVPREMLRLDPNDVESVTILKDGAAAAVYGMKAAAGVILITTKRGAKGEKPQINYHGTLSFSHKTTMPDFMNGTEYMMWYNKARSIAYHFDKSQPSNDKFTPEEIAMTSNGDPSDGYENTNWMSPLDKAAPTHQHNLSVSGSGKSVRYFVSGGFMDQRGFFKDFKFQKANFRSNIDVDATENITVSLNAAGRFEKSHRPGGLSYNNQEYNNVVGTMMYALPFIPKEYQGIPASGYRGVANAEYAKDNSGFSDSDRTVIELSGRFEYRVPFIKGLKASFLMSYDNNGMDGKSFSNTYQVNHFNFSEKAYKVQEAPNLAKNGSMYVDRDKRTQMMVRPALEYENTFGKHKVSSLVLFERTETSHYKLAASKSDYVIYENPQLTNGAILPSSPTGGSSKTAMAGLVGRINYVYDSKYLFEAAFRYDGSYKFAPGHRWGLFPSLSAGWVISEESFFKNTFNKIDKLKLRASYGQLSNDYTEADLWQRLYAMGDLPVSFGQSTLSKTLTMKNLYLAEDLTWEKTDSYNLGVEFEFANGLFGMDLDVFYKYTFDILEPYSAVFAPSIGGNFPKKENSGRFDNRGIEVQLRHRNKVGDFGYKLTGNFSFSKNRYLTKYEADGTMPWASILGEPSGSIYGYRSLGLARSQEDIQKAATPTFGTLGLGDIMYDDINGDGKIDARDIVRIARSNKPEIMFSFNMELNFKGFDLSALFQGSALVDKMLCGTWDNKATDNTPLTRPFYGGSDNTPLYLVKDSWRPDNPNGKYPRLTTVYNSNNAQLSDFWKVNGAYFRLRTLVFGYTIPNTVVNKLGINNIRMYVSGTNLFTATSFKYLDPEAPNVLQGYYPQQRTISVGLNVTF